jgi:CBS domain containing-hemolysin-like protein
MSYKTVHFNHINHTDIFAVSGSDIALLVVALILFVLTGILAVAETSLVRTNKTKALAAANDKLRGSKALLRLSANPKEFLPSILFSVFVCQTVGATLIGVLVGHLLGGIGVLIVTVCEVLLVFIFAEAIPKHWAITNTDKAGRLVAPAVEFLIKLPLLSYLSKILINISEFFIKPNKENTANVSEMELLAMADVALEEQVIESDERHFIHSVIEFGDTIVREIMKPRADIVAVQKDETVADALDLAINKGYSRLPVYSKNLDDISGFVVTSDLIKFLREGSSEEPVIKFVRQLKFVPETKKVSSLLKEMQSKKFHLSVVVDEYGSTVGLVSLEDIIEELLGEIVDEDDYEEPEITEISPNRYLVASMISIEDVNEAIGIELPVGHWDTLGGLVLDELGHIPETGESFDINGLIITAQKVEGTRIAKLIIEKKHLESETESLLPSELDQ